MSGKKYTRHSVRAYKEAIRHVEGEVQCFLIVRDEATHTDTAVMMTQADRDQFERMGHLVDAVIAHDAFAKDPELTVKAYLDRVGATP